MNVSYYCQHVLGIGHFQRSLEICKAIAKDNSTTLILGGPPVELPSSDINLFQLPGLEMDSNFQNLQPCEPGLTLDQVKILRREALVQHFKEDEPDVFLTELYPFGRKAFRFELDPILAAIKTGQLSECISVCSVRDILVEKTHGLEKFEQRVVDTINSSFDGILVHSDPKIIKLDETFSLMKRIRPPVHYTGYVTTDKVTTKPACLRKEIGLKTDDTLIVASIGGGNVGHEILSSTIQAVKVLHAEMPVHLQIFSGPYCDQTSYLALKEQEDNFIRVNRFTRRFPEWLQTADLSISMAGYNTCMNLICAGIPAIVYPFKQNREQRLRAKRLGIYSPLYLMEEEPRPETLITRIRKQLQLQRTTPQIDYNGAENSAQQIITWFENSHIK